MNDGYDDAFPTGDMGKAVIAYDFSTDRYGMSFASHIERSIELPNMTTLFNRRVYGEVMKDTLKAGNQHVQVVPGQFLILDGTAGDEGCNAQLGLVRTDRIRPIMTRGILEGVKSASNVVGKGLAQNRGVIATCIGIVPDDDTDLVELCNIACANMHKAPMTRSLDSTNDTKRKFSGQMMSEIIHICEYTAHNAVAAKELSRKRVKDGLEYFGHECSPFIKSIGSRPLPTQEFNCIVKQKAKALNEPIFEDEDSTKFAPRLGIRTGAEDYADMLCGQVSVIEFAKPLISSNTNDSALTEDISTAVLIRLPTIYQDGVSNQLQDRNLYLVKLALCFRNIRETISLHNKSVQRQTQLGDPIFLGWFNPDKASMRRVDRYGFVGLFSPQGIKDTYFGVSKDSVFGYFPTPEERRMHDPKINPEVTAKLKALNPAKQLACLQDLLRINMMCTASTKLLAEKDSKRRRGARNPVKVCLPIRGLIWSDSVGQKAKCLVNIHVNEKCSVPQLVVVPGKESKKKGKKRSPYYCRHVSQLATQGDMISHAVTFAKWMSDVKYEGPSEYAEVSTLGSGIPTNIKSRHDKSYFTDAYYCQPAIDWLIEWGILAPLSTENKGECKCMTVPDRARPKRDAQYNGKYHPYYYKFNIDALRAYMHKMGGARNANKVHGCVEQFLTMKAIVAKAEIDSHPDMVVDLSQKIDDESPEIIRKFKTIHQDMTVLDCINVPSIVNHANCTHINVAAHKAAENEIGGAIHYHIARRMAEIRRARYSGREGFTKEEAVKEANLAFCDAIDDLLNDRIEITMSGGRIKGSGTYIDDLDQEIAEYEEFESETVKNEGEESAVREVTVTETTTTHSMGKTTTRTAGTATAH